MPKYTLGLDFGTESSRALLVNLENGEELATAVCNYPHGVIDRSLPDSNATLGADWALQHPGDYLYTMEKTTKEVLKQSLVSPEDIIGIGIDFTACTIIPVDEKGEPLCLKPEFRKNPNAWVKLWKHHAAQPEADKINELALARQEDFLSRYGGKTSSEWFLAKAWQILDEAPEVYEKAYRIIEAADWIVLQLTGKWIRNSCCAGYKGMWDKEQGYPSKDFLKNLDPRLENIYETKAAGEIIPSGTKAGELTETMANTLGLKPGIAVAAGIIDAHASMPAVGAVTPGPMVMIMGTSSCQMLLDTKKHLVEGMCGVVADGIIPGYYGYEAGQCAVGDIFAWFIKNCVPEEYELKAREKGLSIHSYLEKLAEPLGPGSKGVLALDWWAGNRSILVDADLTGLLIGCTLNTRPEEIYRALIEATAFGTRMIIEAFENQGVHIDELYACGGLTEKNRMLTQIYADVTGREMKIGGSPQICALGSAMFGALAAGKANGGFDNLEEAAKIMAKIREETFKPNLENKQVYDKLFSEYQRLHNYFGRGENNVMKFLKSLRLAD